MNPDREALEEKARATRERLLDKIDLLERRRHTITRVVAPMAAGALALGTFFAARGQQRRRRALLLDWVAPSPPSFAAETGRRLLQSGVALAATHLLRWAVYRLLPIAPSGAAMVPRRQSATRGEVVAELAGLSPR